MSARWSDVSSHSRNDKERTPKTFALDGMPVSVVVTRHLHFPVDAWVLRCSSVGIDAHQLKSTEIKDAQHEAIDLVHKKLSAWTAALGKVATR